MTHSVSLAFERDISGKSPKSQPFRGRAITYLLVFGPLRCGVIYVFVTVTLPEGRHHRAALFSPPWLEYHRCNTWHQVDGAEDILSGNGSFHQQSRCRMSGYCAIWSSKKPGDFESDVWGLQWLQMLRLNQNSRTRFSHCMYLPRTPFSGQNDSDLNGHMANLPFKIMHYFKKGLESINMLSSLWLSALPSWVLTR